MKEKIQQQVIDTLQVLADKLGTTAEFLWEVLLIQAKVEAVVAIMVVLISGTMLALSLKLAYRNRDFNDDSKFPPFFLGLLLTIGTASALIYNLLILPTLLINPEYWALQEVLKKLGG